MRGVTLYVGTTGTGKTHAALEDLKRIGMPIAVLDLGGSALLMDTPRSKRGNRKRPRWERFSPETKEEYDKVLRDLFRRGNTAILIDDAAALPSQELSKLCRLWRPRNLRVLMTTQHISGDISQAVMACDPLIYAFRTTSPRSLEWLEKWHGVDPAEVHALELGEALELSF